jgi:NAD(P)-dependent dehydrogenase (short-subunit alcohol dehydrogenase family)
MDNKTVGSMNDKTAIITGGSRGLGRNTAVNLARRGVNVIFTYRSRQWEEKRQGSVSIQATFAHFTDSWRKCGRRCKAGVGSGLTTL